MAKDGLLSFSSNYIIDYIYIYIYIYSMCLETISIKNY